MQPLTVTHTSARGEEHVYRGHLIASVVADFAWSGGGQGNAVRPIFFAVAASHGEAGPLAAALARGAIAEVPNGDGYSRSKPTRYELLRSAGYARLTQATPAGVLTTFYLPELYQRDPGLVDPERAAFAVLPRADWVAAQRYDAAAIDAHLARVRRYFSGWDYGGRDCPTIDATWTPQARLFGEALDRRTPAPLLTDDAFLVQLLRAAVDTRMAVLSGHRKRDSYGEDPYRESGVADAGYARGLAFAATQQRIADLVGVSARLYFGQEVNLGAA